MLSHRQLLERNLEWRPNETALVDLPSNQTYTYEEFDSEVNKLANGLRDRGLRKGDRVAMVLYNTLEFPVMLYAIYKVGAIPVPANYMLAQDNFKYIFDDVNPEFVVYDADVGEKLEGAIEDAVRTPDKICVGDEPADGESYDVVRSSGTAETPPAIPMNPGDVAYILYTSGTTGVPKGVTFSGKTALNRAQEGMLYLGLSQDSVALQVSPWFHAGGIDLTIHPTICAGGTILVTRDWEPEPVAALIEDRGITHIVGVPTVAQRIANMDDVDQRDFSSLECMMCMGSPLSEQLANNLLENLTPNIHNGYGTTETLLDSALGPENLPEQAGTVGRASPDKQVQVVEFDQERDVQPHETVPAGEEGEVIVSGGAVLDYYFGNQEATDESLRRGWYYTGDLGVKSEDGFLTITGRVDDMILSGGELVSPIEVEETLEQHDAVEAAGVVGKSDEEWGQVVKAYVATDGTVDEDEIETFCREHTGLADYKRPRVYELVDELERTATGKKQRYKYRD